MKCAHMVVVWGSRCARVLVGRVGRVLVGRVAGMQGVRVSVGWVRASLPVNAAMSIP